MVQPVVRSSFSNRNCLQGVGLGLSDHSIFTSSELCAILDAVSLVCQRGVNSVIICNSNPALQSISAVKHTQTLVVQQSLSFDIPKPVCQIFMDVRSCKEICSLSLHYYLSRVHSAALFPIWRRRDKEMPFSVTINHYESPCRNKYIYRRQGLMVLRHNVVSTRQRLCSHPPVKRRGRRDSFH